MTPTRRRILPLAVALAALSVFMALPSTCFAQTPVPLPAEPTVLTQLLGALSGGHYLGLVMLATVYLRKLASPASGFPLNIKPQYLPTVSAFGGLVYGFEASLQGGHSVSAAALQALIAAASSGFFDGLVTAIVNHGVAPKWAQTLVWLVDDVAGGTGGGGGAAGDGAVAVGGLRSVTPSRPTTAAAKRMGFAAATMVAIAVLCTGCITVSPTVTPTQANQQKIDDCRGTGGYHNGAVIAGIGLGGVATTAGTVAAVDSTDKNVQTGAAYTAAISAGLAAVSAGVAGFTAASFTNNRCTDVVSPLPMKDPKAEAWPADWSPPRVVESVDIAGKVMTAAGAQ